MYGPDVSRRVLQCLRAGGLCLQELAVLLEAEAQLPPHVTTKGATILTVYMLHSISQITS